MKIFQTIRDALTRKTACYKCGQRTAHPHKATYNFHGTLTHVNLCDQCFAELQSAGGQGGLGDHPPR